jgi:hypothetical protein
LTAAFVSYNDEGENIIFLKISIISCYDPVENSVTVCNCTGTDNRSIATTRVIERTAKMSSQVIARYSDMESIYLSRKSISFEDPSTVAMPKSSSMDIFSLWCILLVSTNYSLGSDTNNDEKIISPIAGLEKSSFSLLYDKHFASGRSDWSVRQKSKINNHHTKSRPHKGGSSRKETATKMIDNLAPSSTKTRSAIDGGNSALVHFAQCSEPDPQEFVASSLPDMSYSQSTYPVLGEVQRYIQQAANGNRQDSETDGAGSSRNSAQSRKGDASKRKRGEWSVEHGDDGDEEGHDAAGSKKAKQSESSKPSLLACPFYKRNPSKYQRKSCGSAGWTTVHRIK